MQNTSQKYMEMVEQKFSETATTLFRTSLQPCIDLAAGQIIHNFMLQNKSSARSLVVTSSSTTRRVFVDIARIIQQSSSIPDEVRQKLINDVENRLLELVREMIGGFINVMDTNLHEAVSHCERSGVISRGFDGNLENMR